MAAIVTQSASADERDDREDGAGTPSVIEVAAARQAQVQEQSRLARRHEEAAAGSSIWPGMVAVLLAVISAIAVWMVS
jgi:hypothetical protein